MNDKLAKTNTTTVVNLRTEPTIESDVILVIPKGKSILVDSLGREWSKVLSGGKLGYVSTQYLKIDNKLISQMYEITYKESLLSGAAIPFFVVLCIFYIIGYLKAQTTDRRYKSGKRTDEAILIPIVRKGFYYGFIAAAICVLPLSLIFIFLILNGFTL